MKQKTQQTQKTAKTPIQNGTISQHQLVLQGQLYNGPIPHPDILKGFAEISPDYPERIMKMAEEHSKANIKEQNRTSLSNALAPIIGQFITLIIFLSGLTSGIILAVKGISYGAVSAIVAAIAPILVANIHKK